MEAIQKVENQIQETKKKYLRCTKCGKVHEESKWVQCENGFLCPSCAVLGSSPVEFVFAFDMQDIVDLINTREAMSELKSVDKELTERIKPALVSQNVTEFELEGYKLSVSYTDKGEVLDDLLVALIESKVQDTIQNIANSKCPVEVARLQNEMNMYNAAIVVKKVTEPNMVKALVSSGKLTMEELSKCKTKNIVPTFSPKGPKKKKEKIEKIETPKFQQSPIPEYNTVERKDML